MWVNLHTLPAGRAMYTVAGTTQPVETPEAEREIEELDIVLPTRLSSLAVAQLAEAEMAELLGEGARIVGVANQSDAYVMREDWEGILLPA